VQYTYFSSIVPGVNYTLWQFSVVTPLTNQGLKWLLKTL